MAKKRPKVNGEQRPDQDPTTGRFRPGNKAAVGRSRPQTELRRATLQARMMEAVEEELDEIVAGLIARAKAGEGWAVKLLLDRVLGRPTEGLSPRAVDARLIMEGRRQVAEAEAWVDAHGQAILDDPDAVRVGLTREDLIAVRLNPRNLQALAYET